MTVRILRGDCRDVLRTLPDESVHCVVTSPPYWGLRDYGVVGQLGLETTPQEYVAHMVEVFREVRRVLRADGTLWLNLGDSYTSGGRTTRDPGKSTLHPAFTGEHNEVTRWRPEDPPGLKPKDLLGVPWRVAFALQADGWYLRQDIIWHKPNPMPESIQDRCTKAHEYVFLLSKSERYAYDAEAIKEPASELTNPRRAGNGAKVPAGWATGETPHNAVAHQTAKTHRKIAGGGDKTKNNQSFNQAMAVMPDKRNKRSVWTVASSPFSEAHFATFPPALIEPCVLAGCPVGGTVLDPFGGAGTTGLVADRHGRNAILIELNPEYAAMAERRITGDSPLFAEVTA